MGTSRRGPTGRYHGISEPLLHPGHATPTETACTPINRPFDGASPGMRSAFPLRCHRDAGPDARLFTRHFEVFASGTGCTFESRLAERSPPLAVTPGGTRGVGIRDPVPGRLGCALRRRRSGIPARIEAVRRASVSRGTAGARA